MCLARWALLLLSNLACVESASGPQCPLDFALLQPPGPQTQAQALRVIVQEHPLQRTIAQITALILRSLLSINVEEISVRDSSHALELGFGQLYDLDPAHLQTFATASTKRLRPHRTSDTRLDCLRGLSVVSIGPLATHGCPEPDSGSAVIDLGDLGLATQPGVFATSALEAKLNGLPGGLPGGPAGLGPATAGSRDSLYYKLLRNPALLERLPIVGSQIPAKSLEGRFIPPWCRDGNVSGCREIFHITASADSQRLETMVRFYELPLVISYLGSRAWEALMVNWDSLPAMLLYSYFPNGVNEVWEGAAAQRLRFPSSRQDCADNTTREGATSACDWPLLAPRPVVAPRVWQDLPVVLLLMARMNFTWDALRAISKEARLKAQSHMGEAEALRQAVCAFMQLRRDHFQAALEGCLHAGHPVDVKSWTCLAQVTNGSSTSTTTRAPESCPLGMAAALTATGQIECECARGYHLPHLGPNIADVWNWAKGNRSLSTLQSISDFDEPLENLRCLPCAPGYVCAGGGAPPARCYWEHTTTRPKASFQSECVCDYGYGGTETGKCMPCGIRRYKEQIGNHECFGICPVFATTLRVGAVNRAFCACTPGYFVERVQPSLHCVRCPEGASCSGGLEIQAVLEALWPYDPFKLLLAHTLPVSTKGFHPRDEADPQRMNRLGESVYRPLFSRCQSYELCLGNNTCRQGMEGLLCSSCAPGWGRAQLLGGLCHPCWGSAGTVMGISLVFIFFIMAVVIFTAGRAGRNPDLLGTVVFKIAINHLDFMLFFGDGAASEIFSAQDWFEDEDPARHAFIQGVFGFIHSAAYFRHVYGPGSWALYCQISEHPGQLDIYSRLVFTDPSWPRVLRVEFIRYVVALLVPLLLPIIIYGLFYPIYRCKRRRQSQDLQQKTHQLAILQKLRRAAYLTDPKPVLAISELNKYLEHIKNSCSSLFLLQLLRDESESLDLEIIAGEIHVADITGDNQLNKAELCTLCGRLRHLLPLAVLQEAVGEHVDSGQEVIPCQDFFRKIMAAHDKQPSSRCPTLWAVSLDSIPLVLVFTFLAYPTVIKHLVSGILCENGAFVGLDNFRLRSDLEIQCYKGSHWSFMACGIVGVLLWGLGVPFWVYRILRRSLKKPSMRNRCSFHLNGCDRAKPGSFCWDVVMYLAKLVLFTAEVVPFRFTRKIIVIAWCSALMMLHGLAEPFDQRRKGILNFLEKLSFTTITISVICFQACLDVKMRPFFIVVAIGLSSIVNVFFFLCCVWEWWKDIRIMVSERVHKVKAQQRRDRQEQKQANEMKASCLGSAEGRTSVQQDPLTALGIMEVKENAAGFTSHEQDEVRESASDLGDLASKVNGGFLMRCVNVLSSRCSLVFDRVTLLRVAEHLHACWGSGTRASWAIMRYIHHLQQKSLVQGFVIVLSDDHFHFRRQQLPASQEARTSSFQWADHPSRTRGRCWWFLIKCFRRAESLADRANALLFAVNELRKHRAEKLEVARVVGHTLRSILLSNESRSIPVTYIEYFFRKTHLHCHFARAAVGSESLQQVTEVLRQLQELENSGYAGDEEVSAQEEESLFVQKVLALNMEQKPDTEVSFRVTDLEIFLMSLQDEALRTMLHDVQAASWRVGKRAVEHKECEANGKLLSCSPGEVLTAGMSRWGGFATMGRGRQETSCLKPGDGPAPPPEWKTADRDTWTLPSGLKAFGVIEDLPRDLREEFEDAIVGQQDAFKYSLLDQIPQAIELLAEARTSMPVLNSATHADWRKARWILMQLEPQDAQRVFSQLRERLNRDGWECCSPLWVYNVAKRCLHNTALFKTPAGVSVLGAEEAQLVDEDGSRLHSYRGEVSAGSSIYIDVALVSLDQLKAELFLAHLVRLKLDRFQKLLDTHRESAVSPTWQLLKLHAALRTRWHPDQRAEDVKRLEELLQGVSLEEQQEVLAAFKWKEEEFMHQTSDWVFGRCYMEMVAAPSFNTKQGCSFYDETYLAEPSDGSPATVTTPFFDGGVVAQSHSTERAEVDVDLPLDKNDSEEAAVLKLQERLFLFMKHEATFRQYQSQLPGDPGRARGVRAVKDAAASLEKLQDELLETIRSGRYANFRSRVEFSVQLDLSPIRTTTFLEVWILSARDLCIGDAQRDTLEVFCTCYLEGKPESELATKSVEGTLCPVWNHKAEMLEYTPGDSLVFNVWDKDFRGEVDSLLGRTTLSSSSLEAGADKEKADKEAEYPLKSTHSRGKAFLQVKARVVQRSPDLLPMVDGSLLVNKLRPDGPLAIWNETHADEKVQVGDRLVEAGGQQHVRHVVMSGQLTHESCFAMVRREIVEVKLAHMICERPMDALDILTELEMLRAAHHSWSLESTIGIHLSRENSVRAWYGRWDPNLTHWLLGRIQQVEENEFSLRRTRRGFPYMVLPKIDISFDTTEGEDVQDAAAQADCQTTYARRCNFQSQADLAPTPQMTAGHLARELHEFETAKWDLDRLVSLRHEVHGALKNARKRCSRYTEQLQEQLALSRERERERESSGAGARVGAGAGAGAGQPAAPSRRAVGAEQ